jgi:DNA-binding CsgD family transcriptional regulator
MFVLMTTSEIQKPSCPETLLGPPVRRERSTAARRAAHLDRAEREARILSLLNRGVAIAEIAAREGLSLKRMRNLVREILAQRMPQPPAEFLALQVSRLNEALLVSYSAIHASVAGANFEAVDRVVKIVRELDRYHGFGAVPRPREDLESRRLPPPVERPLALEGPRPSDSEMAPQAIEKARFGLENCER